MVPIGHQQYQRADVTLASPETLVVLLYGELLRCLIRAKEATTRGDTLARRENKAKAVRILAALMAALNMEKGETVALNLAMLYEHIAKKLLQSNRDSDTESFDEAIRLLAPLKEAWEAISASSLMTAPTVSFCSVVA